MYGALVRIQALVIAAGLALTSESVVVESTTNGQLFRQIGYIKASNSDNADRFGSSLAVSENTIVIGAQHEDSNSTGINGDQHDETAGNAGAVYVFVYDAFGTIQQQAYLKASNSDGLDRFGSSVAISGDMIVVGAPNEDSSSAGVNGDQFNDLAQGSGAAYVFVRSGSTWSQQAYLKASNADQLDEFGGSVDILDNTIVVGAKFEDSAATGVNNQSSDRELLSGAAYIFERSGSEWSQTAYLKASNTDSDDQFGTVVAVADDTVVVTAPNESSGATGIDGDQGDNSGFQSGAAYVFSRDEFGQWFQESYIKSSNSDDFHQFGLSASIDDDTIAIGAPVENGGPSNSEDERSKGTITFSGAAYVFLRDEAEGWQEQAYIKASNAGQFDEFGNAVSVSGNMLLVGAALEDSDATGIGGTQASDAARNSGAAYLFERNEQGVWSQNAYVKASTVDSVDLFGHSVAIFGTNFIAGAIGEDSGATGINGDQNNSVEPNSGAAYFFGLPAFRVGGLVRGLSGTDLVLQINDSEDLQVNSNGSFTFDQPFRDGSSFDVRVVSHPEMPVQYCSVSNGSGVVNGTDVFNVRVGCEDGFTLGGAVTGLELPGLTLWANDQQGLLFERSSGFIFDLVLPDGAPYEVTPGNIPIDHNCSFSNPVGTISGASIDDIDVVCTTDILSASGFENLSETPIQLD